MLKILTPEAVRVVGMQRSLFHGDGGPRLREGGKRVVA